MDIIFINSKDQIGNSNDAYNSLMSGQLEMLPLGILYMATILEKKGYSSEVYDLNTTKNEEGVDKILDTIIRKKPLVVGISSSTTTFPAARRAAQKIRNSLGDNCTIVWGGLHVTFLPEDAFANDLADIVVRGEGEEVILDILDAVIRKNGELAPGELERIKGISYKKDGRIIHNSPPVLKVNDLDSLPFPKRDFIDLEQYRNPGTIISSRGCVAKCQFCAAGAFGTINKRTAGNVIGEGLELHNKYNMQFIHFVDNTFCTHKQRALEILHGLKNVNPEMKFFMESRVSQVNEEFIKSLSEAGVSTIHYGVETGNEQILEDIHKKITLEQVVYAVEISLKYNIGIYCTFIIGHPNDTVDTVKDTVHFAKSLQKKGAVCCFFPLTPFPGTEIFNKRKELNIEILDWNYENWNFVRSVIRTRYLSRRDISNLIKFAYSEINAV